MNDATPDQAAFTPPPLPSYARFLWTALVVIAGLVGGTLGWGMFARLDSAIVAQGVVLAESERKVVQHLEGGILETLLVRPGQRVRAGEPVARLDSTQITELLLQLRQEAQATALERWRLAAEEVDADRLDPDAAPGGYRPAAAAMIDRQVHLFEARRLAHASQLAALAEQIEQLRAEIEASTGRARAAERQLDVLRREHAIVADLTARGIAPRVRLFELERAIAVQEGDRDQHRNQVEALRKRIQQATTEVETLGQQRRADIAERAMTAERRLLELESRIRGAEDVLARHVLVAPQDGIVVDIRIVTPGGVLAPGEPLMDIVPENDRLVVASRLPPDSINTVHVGRPAQVRLTAYKRSRAPMVEGEVGYVSADLLEDPRDGSRYFETRVVLEPAAVAALVDAELVPGMPVEVMIKTGARRAGDYFLEPLALLQRRAFAEE